MTNRRVVARANHFVVEGLIKNVSSMRHSHNTKTSFGVKLRMLPSFSSRNEFASHGVDLQAMIERRRLTEDETWTLLAKKSLHSCGTLQWCRGLAKTLDSALSCEDSAYTCTRVPVVTPTRRLARLRRGPVYWFVFVFGPLHIGYGYSSTAV